MNAAAAADPRRAGAASSSRTEEDQRAIEEYRRKYGQGPFLAADAVVQSSDGHVLLIRRSKAPGRGLLALPGGFVEPGETFLEAAIRELIEETGVHVAELSEENISARFSPEREAVFDAPDRDPRARIVSVAYFFSMRYPAEAMPIKAADDAARADWMKIGKEIGEEDFFADHFHILQRFGLVPERRRP